MNKKTNGSISSNTAVFDATYKYDLETKALIANWQKSKQYIPDPVLDNFDSDINFKLNEPLLHLLFEPMEPATFCMRWLPILRGLNWGDRGSRQIAQQMLAQLTGLAPSSWDNYLLDPRSATAQNRELPIIYKRYLRAIDLLFQFLRLFRIPLKRLIA